MEPFNFDKHTSQQFNEELQAVKADLLAMGGKVEGQIEDAVNALENADSDLASKVLTVEKTINTDEVDVNEECTRILVRRQPAASDLRLVLAISRTARDLERAADEAKKIAKMALKLCDEGPAPRGYVEVRHISQGVSQMIRQALDAFARFDAELALSVAKHDEIIDREYETALREMMTLMMEDPRSIKRVMNILWSLRSLERIGDHASNIAEHVIYLVKGKDVRNVSLEEMEQQVKG